MGTGAFVWQSVVIGLWYVGAQWSTYDNFMSALKQQEQNFINKYNTDASNGASMIWSLNNLIQKDFRAETQLLTKMIQAKKIALQELKAKCPNLPV